MTALVTHQVSASQSNYTVGRQGHQPRMLMVHVMNRSLIGTGSWFANPASHVSAHYGVGTGGEIHQYVAETNTAWHAGQFEVNLESIGVEHEGRQRADHPAWTPTTAQLEASTQLAATICKRWGITPGPETIVRHSSLSPQHVQCPGPGFPLEDYIARVLPLLAALQGSGGLGDAGQLLN